MVRASAVLVAAALALSACASAPEIPTAPTTPQAAPAPSGQGARSSRDYRRVKSRVEPVAEAFCREEAPRAPPIYCDFAMVLDERAGLQANAFQTRANTGQPVVVVTGSLLGQMRSDDEIAFVLAHEAAHHIAEHLPRQQQSQVIGALILGGMVAAAGEVGGAPVTQDTIRQAMDLGAFVGGRAYSQDYELEADWLGAFVTARAGYDPEAGAAVFGRPALSGGGGPVILSTHPASPQRQALVSRAAAEIRRQQAAGLTPRPGRSGT